MGYPRFQENQTYQLSCIYNQKDDWVFNEIYMGNWCWKKQKKFLVGDIIILILLASDKTMMSLSHRNQVF